MQTQKDKKRRKSGSWNQVFNSRNQRVRGLWERNGRFYAQVRTAEWVGRVPLEHASNLTEALAAWQELKTQIRAGKFVPPSKKVGQQESDNGSSKSTIKAMIASYQADRDLHKRKDEKTRKHEDVSFRRWVEFAGKKLVEDISGKLLNEFTTWRRKQKPDISGRSINVNVLALKNALSWAVTAEWIPEFPSSWSWEDLPETPKKVRLLETEEVEFLANASRLSPEAIAMLDRRVKHLREAQQVNGQYFHDFVWLLALSGGREEETVAKEWSHVKWVKKQLHFPGELAKAGGGQPAKDRDVDFHDKLEVHLKAMFERRDKTSNYMFPAGDEHTKSFRSQLERARVALRNWHIEKGKSEKEARKLCDDIGFHHFRHYFISHCVMAGIDYMTIAIWVSHSDGGILIGKVYGHLRPGHSAAQAKKLSSSF